MNIVSAESLYKSYGSKVLLDRMTFGIEEGEKIGLIGVNGTGKTTLLRMLAGFEPPDDGRLAIGKGANIAYLPQNPSFDGHATVLEQVFQGESAEMLTLREYERTLQLTFIHPSSEELQAKLVRLGQRMEELGAWQLETEAKVILTKLGITDFSAQVGHLSGGQRRRVAMANALIKPCDLLLLDEPTNHIDNDTVEWLEQYLQRRRGALMMITHDRYFLDRVVDRMIELDKGQLYSYTGNYSRFLELKAEREGINAAAERKRVNLYRNELAWMRQGAKARTTKQKARIERFEKLKDAAADLSSEKIEIGAGASRLGKKVIELEHVSKSFEGRTLIHDFSYVVTRHDRIGIVGPNGCGKTTLLRMIAGVLEPDGGVREQGPTVNIGCFFQENDDMDEKLRVIEYIKEAAEVIYTTEGEAITAAQMLERFLFPPAAQWTPISRLSGGEKRRLYLLRVLMGAPNVLLLDEPTNDLDIQTLSVLEQYLEQFPGAVIAVSHDRYFLDRVAETVIAFEENASVHVNVGNYSEYMEYRKRIGALSATGSGVAKPRAAEPADAQQAEREGRKKDRPLKFTYKEQREYEQIEGQIAEAERELVELVSRMDEAGSDAFLLQQLTQHQQELEARLEELMDKWTYLTELAEQIAQAKS